MRDHLAYRCARKGIIALVTVAFVAVSIPIAIVVALSNAKQGRR